MRMRNLLVVLIMIMLIGCQADESAETDNPASSSSMTQTTEEAPLSLFTSATTYVHTVAPTTTPIAVETAAPSEIVPSMPQPTNLPEGYGLAVVGRSHKYLLCGWDGEDWLDIKNAQKLIQPGLTFSRYLQGDYAGYSILTDFYYATIDTPDFVEVHFDNAVYDNGDLLISANWDVFPRTIKYEEDPGGDVKGLYNIAIELGIDESTLNFYSYRVDLDGDGVDEWIHCLVKLDEPFAGMRFFAEYSAVILQYLSNEVWISKVLFNCQTVSRYPDQINSFNHAPYRYSIATCADLNDDGNLEMVIKQEGYSEFFEGNGYHLVGYTHGDVEYITRIHAPLW